MAVNLRLSDFIPGLLVPPEANLVLTFGIHFLIFALYTLTITSHPRTLALVVGVHFPPRWIVNGKVAPLPTTFLGRLGYAVDYLSSLRGTSMFKNTTWDWIAPSTKPCLPSPSTPRMVFLPTASWSQFKQYTVLDALDTLSKSRRAEFDRFPGATMAFIVQAGIRPTLVGDASPTGKGAHSTSCPGVFSALEVEDLGKPVTAPSQPSVDVGLRLANDLDEFERTTFC
ncbi:hypothetical protein FRC06_009923, partial [Ceratobasidium sp. 370]